MSNTVFTGDVYLNFSKRRVFKTLVTDFEDGKEQRRTKWTRPKHIFKWQSDGLLPGEADYIYDFFNTMEGRGDSFYFEVTDESPTSQSGDETIAQGDGSDRTFQFDRYPVKSGDCSLTLSNSAGSGDTPQTEGGDYTVNYTTGAITFGSAPGTGDTITATSYRFYYAVRFAEDYLDRKQFAYQLYNFGINLVEVI